MCMGCWNEYGRPNIDNEMVRAAVPLIRSVYDFSAVGGNLHCELDDWNIDNNFFEGEFDPYDKAAPEDQLAAERKCFDAFKAMTLDERASALARFDGFI